MRIGNVMANCIDASLVSSMPVLSMMARKTIATVVTAGASTAPSAGMRRMTRSSPKWPPSRTASAAPIMETQTNR